MALLEGLGQNWLLASDPSASDSLVPYGPAFACLALIAAL